MPKPGFSLQSTLRKSVIQSYRARGKGLGNLWLVYSVKTDQDWILPSDRQLVHWLYYLEFNPLVVTFDLAPEPILSKDDLEIRATELDAIVTYSDGHIEWHEVKAGTDTNAVENESQKIAQTKAASAARVKYSRFNDLNLKSNAQIALRYLKALGYAEAIRGMQYNEIQTKLILFFRSTGSGVIKQITEYINHDISIVLGLIVRLAATGVLTIDLEKSSFGLLTHWTYHE